MKTIDPTTLKRIQLSLAAASVPLGEAASSLAGAAAPLVRAPPRTSVSLAQVPLAEVLSAHAAPVARAAPVVASALALAMPPV